MCIYLDTCFLSMHHSPTHPSAHLYLYSTHLPIRFCQFPLLPMSSSPTHLCLSVCYLCISISVHNLLSSFLHLCHLSAVYLCYSVVCSEPPYCKLCPPFPPFTPAVAVSTPTAIAPDTWPSGLLFITREACLARHFFSLHLQALDT